MKSKTTRADPGFIKGWIFATDHKTVGIQFLFFALSFFAIGGLLAMLVRWQLAYAGDARHPVPVLSFFAGAKQGTILNKDGLMVPDFYNVIFTMHATIMVFFVLIPMLVGAFGSYLIPLKIGAREMAFPFLNGLSFWIAVPAGAILIAGFFLAGGGPAAGWTSYPPLSALSVSNSNWPLLPMVLTGIAFALLYVYVGSRAVRFNSAMINVAMIAVISIIAAIYTVRAVQYIAFDGQACWFLSIMLIGFSNILGAINYLTTIIKLRCPGMFMLRLPLSIWALFITALLVLLATPVLTADLLMNLLDHLRITSFFEPTGWMVSGVQQFNGDGGYPLLHPHLFWFYSHPAVYIMILPAMGMVSDILPVFARKPIFGYRAMIFAMAAIAFLGFIVWGHHMFQSGMNPMLGTTFAVSTMLIAVPSGIKTFNWLATLWGGNIHYSVAMCNALAFISMFVIGGLSGIFMASTAVDVHIHMTYFIVAHLHYVLFGGSTFGIFAAIYFWFPKMFGRMLNQSLGYIHFFGSFICFNGTFLLMHVVGLQGMPRRVADPYFYSTFRHLQPMNLAISHFAFGLGLFQIPFVINFLGSLVWGRKAPANPWNATTLEWNDTPSPPPFGNFESTPVVCHGPYEYSSPLVEEDWLAQTRMCVK